MHYPYMIDNTTYAHRAFARNVADNGEKDDAACGIQIAPGGICGQAAPLLVVWQWSNGDPTLIAIAPAGYQSYGDPVGLGVSNEYLPEWLQQFGAPTGEELGWLSDVVYASLADSSHPGFEAFLA